MEPLPVQTRVLYHKRNPATMVDPYLELLNSACKRTLLHVFWRAIKWKRFHVCPSDKSSRVYGETRKSAATVLRTRDGLRGFVRTPPVQLAKRLGSGYRGHRRHRHR